MKVFGFMSLIDSDVKNVCTFIFSYFKEQTE